MRRIVTWCVVGAVAALVLAAGIDALRDGGEPESAGAVESEPTTTGPSEPSERTLGVAGADLRRAGVPAGRLVYSDEDCRSHVLLLPDLAERPPRNIETCPLSSADGSEADRARAECRHGRLMLWTGAFDDPELYARERGCGAAWKPDGTVTFIQDGGVRRFVRCPGDGPGAPLLCSRPVLATAALTRQLREQGWAARKPRVKELVWLDGRRFAAIYEQRTPDGRYDNLVLFDRGRLVREPVGPYDELGGLKPSPTGSRVGASETERGGIVAIDGLGDPIHLALDSGSGIAWSPDEQWIAEATEGGIYVFRADEDSPELIHIPVVARDVLWAEP